MEWTFDRVGFKFVVKFVGQFVLFYFLTSFLSNFVFSNIYEDREYVSENVHENLAVVINQDILPDKKQQTVVLGFVGDIMLDRGVEDVVLSNGGGDFKFVFNRAEEELNNVDLLIGNLEGPISSRGKNVGSAYSFRMDTRVVGGLKFAGFDALSVANNHSGDWGKEAFSDTLSILREANIIPVGATTSP
ncbi:MAG: Poly-gamma-glutamate biosynthesis protein, partial [Parcubacteria group bacterium GW2011_GWC1_43_30]